MTEFTRFIITFYVCECPDELSLILEYLQNKSGWDINYPFGPFCEVGDTLIDWAYDIRNYDMISMLLKYGANPNGINGSPLINVLCRHSSDYSINESDVLPIVQLLLNHGLKVENSKVFTKTINLSEFGLDQPNDPLIQDIMRQLTS